jgi:hypothetical protein
VVSSFQAVSCAGAQRQHDVAAAGVVAGEHVAEPVANSLSLVPARNSSSLRSMPVRRG